MGFVGNVDVIPISIYLKLLYTIVYVNIKENKYIYARITQTKKSFSFIDMHHMSLDDAQGKILNSKLWEIECEVDNCLKYVPIIT